MRSQRPTTKYPTGNYLAHCREPTDRHTGDQVHEGEGHVDPGVAQEDAVTLSVYDVHHLHLSVAVHGSVEGHEEVGRAHCTRHKGVVIMTGEVHHHGRGGGGGYSVGGNRDDDDDDGK